jgi:hypothetical protein
MKSLLPVNVGCKCSLINIVASVVSLTVTLLALLAVCTPQMKNSKLKFGIQHYLNSSILREQLSIKVSTDCCLH